MTTSAARTYARQKAALTHAIRSKDYAKVIAECERVIAEWETLPYGWPDDWHRWNIALEDAYSHACREYGDGRGQRPTHVTLDQLRYQIARAAAAPEQDAIDAAIAVLARTDRYSVKDNELGDWIA